MLREVWGSELAARFAAHGERLRAEVLGEHADLAADLAALAGANEHAAGEDGSTADEQRAELEQRIESLCLERFHAEVAVAVALAGRVPVKVDASFGAIRPGDALTASPIPGVAMRSDGSGIVVGTALEGLARGTGKVLAFIQRSFQTPMGPIERAQAELAEELDERTPDPTTGIQTMAGNLQLVLDRNGDNDARFSIFRDGALEGQLGDEVFRVDEAGNVFAKGAFRPASMDLAEYFALSEPASVGELLVVDPEQPGRYRPARTPQDPAVVGIVSAKPGVLLGSGIERIAAADAELEAQLEEARQLGDEDLEASVWASLQDRFRETHAPIALSGTVPCKVDAGYGAIRPGDLLTTSATPGHAMLAGEAVPGTIVGKALEALESGTGTIKVLVMLR
jgi:hypothetical protein